MQFSFRLPQQPPYAMIDAVLEHSLQHIRCRYTVSADNWLVDAQGFTPEGMIECLAQAAAAKASIESAEAGLGYLVVIKAFSCTGTVAVDETVELELRLLHDMAPFKVFEGTMLYDGTIIASGEIRTFENP